jgi:hypothetical protein
MTLAICTDCGASKHGAFSTCSECGFRPIEARDLAKSMMLTDHFFKADQLHAFGTRIKDKETVSYDEKQLQQWIEEFESDPEALDRLQHPEKYRASIVSRIGCIAIPVLFLGLILYAAILAVCRFLKN